VTYRVCAVQARSRQGVAAMVAECASLSTASAGGGDNGFGYEMKPAIDSRFGPHGLPTGKAFLTAIRSMASSFMGKDTSHSSFRQGLVLVGVGIFVIGGVLLLGVALSNPSYWGGWLAPVVSWACAFCAYRESRRHGSKDDQAA
jgi:hypothetical protein